MSIRNREDLTRHVVEKLQGAVEQVWEKTVTAAQMLALFTTPVSLIDAPGPNRMILPSLIVVEKPAGTAYTLGTAGPLNIGIGVAPATFSLINFVLAGMMDQATKQSRVGFLPDPASAVVSGIISPINNVTRMDNQALYLRQATANMTAGNTVLRLHIYGRILPVDLTFTW